MKIALDERLKHRLIGLAVLASVAVMIIPAIMKKPTHSFDNMNRVSIRLPAKPQAPSVVSVNEARLFQTVKVAKVAVHKAPAISPVAPAMQAVSLQAKQEAPETLGKPLQAVLQAALLDEQRRPPEMSFLPPLPQLMVAEQIAQPVRPVAISTPAAVQLPASAAGTVKKIAHKETTPRKPVKKPVLKVGQPMEAQWADPPGEKRANRAVSPRVSRAAYAVQVANFASLDNATHLIHRLRAQGFQAAYQRHGHGYIVLVGASDKREVAMRVRQQLHQQLQLEGFVVSGASVG